MNKASRVVLLGCISLTAVASANLEERIEALELSAQMSEQQNKLSLGGYGELHVNSKQDGGDSTFDYHRAVMYVGYQFNDWIRLNSEIELEHAKAGKGPSDADGGNDAAEGYVLLEQFSLDLYLTDTFGVRLGRTLAPLGIVGPRHEPPLFYGVERTDMEKYILPSTWSIDGAGIFGDLSENVSYELYAVGGLDSSGFTLDDGIRGGREAEYAGAEKLSYTGRIDFHGIEGLRYGAAFYQGSTDHGMKGTDGSSEDDNKILPGSEVSILSADFEYESGAFTLNGLWAAGSHDGNGVGSKDYTGAQDFGGYYITAGYTLWQGNGKFAESSITPFVRYSVYDTAENEGGDYERTQVTYGVHMLLSEQVCLKLDYQDNSNHGSGLIDENGKGIPDQVNFGFGFILQ